MKWLQTGSVVLVRLVGLLFAIAAALSVPPTRDMLNSEAEVASDNILYVPIEICIPSDISFADNQTATVPTTENGGCHTLSFFINACVMSLVLSIAATILNFCLDVAARCRFGNISVHAVASMSLFLIFILLQTAVCCWAVAKELDFWNDYFDKLYSEMQEDNNTMYSGIETRGDRLRLIAAGALALFFAFLLLIEAGFNFCCGGAAKRDQSSDTPSSSFFKSGANSPTSTSTMDLEASNSNDYTVNSNSNNNVDNDNENPAFGTTAEMPPWAKTN